MGRRRLSHENGAGGVQLRGEAQRERSAAKCRPMPREVMRLVAELLNEKQPGVRYEIERRD